MPLCFAYGLNMDQAGMAQRAPAARLIGTARLARHRFIITLDGYASVMRDARSDVHGLLWDITFPDLKALDRFEGLERGLYVKINQPIITPQGPRRALIYVGTGAPRGRAKPGYLAAVIVAARAAGLPEDYVRGLGRQ